MLYTYLTAFAVFVILFLSIENHVSPDMLILQILLPLNLGELLLKHLGSVGNINCHKAKHICFSDVIGDKFSQDSDATNMAWSYRIRCIAVD